MTKDCFFSGNLHPYVSAQSKDQSPFSFPMLVWGRGPFPSSCSNTMPAIWRDGESLHLNVLGQVYPTGLSAAWALTRSFLGQLGQKANHRLPEPTTWRGEDHCVARARKVVLQKEPAALQEVLLPQLLTCQCWGCTRRVWEAAACNTATMPLVRASRLLMLWKDGGEDSVIGRLLSKCYLLWRRANGGSLLQTCTPNTVSFQVKYNQNIHIHYISEKCLAYSWLFQELISIC